MRNVRLLLTALGMSAGAAHAQDLNEALNLSNTTVQGTARSIGFGGALGSIGGDFSSLSVNPAGIGVYRTSELSFSPSLKMNYSSSSFQQNTTDDNNTQLNINHFALVLTDAPKGRRYEHHNWKSVSFAVGMNRVADFNHEYNYEGNNYSSSAGLLFESATNGPYDTANAGSLANMGIATHLVTAHLTQHYTTVPFATGISQQNIVQERGGTTEYVVSLGGNYKERLLLGVTVGIPVFSYQRTSNYTETVLPNNADNIYNFSTFTYNNQLNINGTGVNLKLGAILKLTNFFRVGAAFHTPTSYHINDVTNYGLTSTVNNVSYAISTDNSLPIREFNYRFLTPYKGILSASLVIKQIGFITADYEYVDYSTMKFRYGSGIDQTTGTSYTQEENDINKSIKQQYQSASNLRVGAEVKLTRYFMIRGGAGYYGNPNRTGMSMERFDVSAGLGFHGKHFFADVAVVNSSWKYQEQVYADIDYSHVVTPNTRAASPVATVQPTTNNATLTVGFKF